MPEQHPPTLPLRWPASLRTLRAAGVTDDTVRGRRWRRTSRGFYRLGGGERMPLQRVLDAAALIPPGGALTGWAAALLAGIALLDGRDTRTMVELPVTIVLGGPTVRRRAQRGVVLRREAVDPGSSSRRVRALAASGSSVVVGVLPVVGPAQAAFDGMRDSGDLADAVAFADACAHPGWLRLPALAAYLSRRRGVRGIERVRRALPLVDGRSRSPWESRLRVFYQLAAGLPRPLVNAPVFDRRERLLGIADLLDAEAGLVTEFDGQHHRGRRQHRADNEREERFEDAGLTVVRADSLDLREHPDKLVRRLRSGYRRGQQRDRRRDGWTLAEPTWWLAQEDPDEAVG
ncbi:DUF559 domain-containing protein [Desertihabitans aurantiacus]|uniref:DUF559 domain-containing protein n=1 Tax=Desertihabitans aurantiacus TaxID=2282477 RepID=UPI000DF7BB5B|nr:DUF559 domain-containing protein [Desertihabitans aurantiacus]